MLKQTKRICIDARLVDGSSGGVQQFIMGLAWGLGSLTDGIESYHFLAFTESQDWLRPLLGPNSEFIDAGSGHSGVKNIFKKYIPFTKLFWRLYQLARLKKEPKIIAEKLNSLNINLVHFTHQAAFSTSLPSIYHPHDLLHIHFPGFCTRSERFWRSHSYSYFCDQAAMIPVASSWTKEDLVRNLAIPADKIRVIPLAPPIAADPTPGSRLESSSWPPPGIPDTYLFYPAMFWPHKNHLNFIKALALLKKVRGLEIPTVLSGGETPFKAAILHAISEAGLANSIHIAGYIPHEMISSYFTNARAICIPTLFEAGSFPAWEAFHAKVPLACSNVTSLPAQIGDGALFFDPRSPEEMAKAIEQVWRDETVRANLVQNGINRLQAFNWQLTARIFRAHYRSLCGWQLSDEDISLLNASPIM